MTEEEEKEETVHVLDHLSERNLRIDIQSKWNHLLEYFQSLWNHVNRLKRIHFDHEIEKMWMRRHNLSETNWSTLSVAL